MYASFAFTQKDNRNLGCFQSQYEQAAGCSCGTGIRLDQSVSGQNWIIDGSSLDYLWIIT